MKYKLIKVKEGKFHTCQETYLKRKNTETVQVLKLSVALQFLLVKIRA